MLGLNLAHPVPRSSSSEKGIDHLLVSTVDGDASSLYCFAMSKPRKAPEISPTLGASSAWRKSSKSASDGHCVEIAFEGEHVLIRDSKAADGTCLEVHKETFSTFVAQLKG